ncbi:MAG: CAP domain-containing protein [Acidobacteriota bacterium]
MIARALLLLLSLSALIPAGSPEGDGSALRQDLLFRLNRERSRAGLLPLRLVPALSQAAQVHAAEVGRRASSRPEPGGSDAMWRRLVEVGYTAHTWSESLIVSRDGPEDVVHRWRAERQDQGGRGGMSPAFQDVGIGIASYRGAPLYVLLFGWHRGDYFAKQTAGLRDLERIRTEMLDRVNAVRRAAGVRPLLESAELDRAAQDHARDLLLRGYYLHQSPEGTSPGDRALAAGYPTPLVGENLHEDRYTVEQTLDDWLRSPGHRRNLLDPDCTDLGLGLALGEGYGLDASAYRVVWVQDFGRR